MWSSSWARAAVDCRETDGGEVTEEIVMGNARERKLGRLGSKEILLNHA